MSIIGKSVMHITFGEGVIVNQDNNKIEIDFGSFVKSFLYPVAFEKFIRMMDTKTERLINKEIEQLKEVRKLEEQEKKMLLHRVVTKGAHGVFDLNEDELNQFQSSGEINTGRGKTRNTNCMIPQKINMDSACILTMKEKARRESERKIVGICMTGEDFIGERSTNGIIPTHEKYRLMLPEDEPIYFWHVFPEEKRKDNWGSRKLRYVSTAIVEAILSRMFVMIEEEELKTELIAFEEYFNEKNVI